MLKPQDVVLVIKLLCKGNGNWSQASLAAELVMSASEVNAGLKRLDKCGFIELHKDGRRWQVIKPALKEFLLHGIAYIFPAQKGKPTTGVVTAYGHDVLAPYFSADLHAILPVWPARQAKVKGFTLEPLYSTVPKACKIDPLLHEWLALVDCLRDHDNVELEVAKVLLREKLAARKKINKLVAVSTTLEQSSLTDQQLDLLS